MGLQWRAKKFLQMASLPMKSERISIKPLPQYKEMIIIVPAQLAVLAIVVFFEEPSFLTFPNSTYCLTGKFVSGPREKCESFIKRFGGVTTKNITKDLNYLVVGTLGSRDWIASGHGRKIEKALHYKQQGCPLSILSEEYFLTFLDIG